MPQEPIIDPPDCFRDLPDSYGADPYSISALPPFEELSRQGEDYEDCREEVTVSNQEAPYLGQAGETLCQGPSSTCTRTGTALLPEVDSGRDPAAQHVARNAVRETLSSGLEFGMAS